MADIHQFTRHELPHGFKLTKEFFNAGVLDEDLVSIHEILDVKDLIIVTQTNIKNRQQTEYTPVLLDYKLSEQLWLYDVISKIKGGEISKVPQVDGIWMSNSSNDKAILSFSQTAPVVSAWCSVSGNEYVFLSTMLRKDITKENFQKILNLLPPEHSTVTFQVVSSTDYEYPKGTLYNQIRNIVLDLGCIYKVPFDCSNVNHNEELFGHGEKVPGFPELGLANNLVAVM